MTRIGPGARGARDRARDAVARRATTGISSRLERLERELARVLQVAGQLGAVRDAERVEPRAHAGEQPRDLAAARGRVRDQQDVTHGAAPYLARCSEERRGRGLVGAGVDRLDAVGRVVRRRR